MKMGLRISWVSTFVRLWSIRWLNIIRSVTQHSNLSLWMLKIWVNSKTEPSMLSSTKHALIPFSVAKTPSQTVQKLSTRSIAFLHQPVSTSAFHMECPARDWAISRMMLSPGNHKFKRSPSSSLVPKKLLKLPRKTKKKTLISFILWQRKKIEFYSLY